MATAPAGSVTRVGKDTLRIRWANGTRVFADSGRRPGYLEGVGYSYCGFDAVSGLHLIGMNDESEFSGLLLSQRTGQTQPAGARVLFSADRHRYLAVFQVDGREAEDWRVYTGDGRLLWSGASEMYVRDKEMNIDMTRGAFTNMEWTANDELRATITCYRDKTARVVTLVDKGGKLEWQPALPDCH